MTTIFGDGPSFDNMVKELRKVFDRGKFVNISSSTFNLLGRIQVPSIDKIMRKGTMKEGEYVNKVP